MATKPTLILLTTPQPTILTRKEADALFASCDHLAPAVEQEVRDTIARIPPGEHANVFAKFIHDCLATGVDLATLPPSVARAAILSERYLRIDEQRASTRNRIPRTGSTPWADWQGEVLTIVDAHPEAVTGEKIWHQIGRTWKAGKTQIIMNVVTGPVPECAYVVGRRKCVDKAHLHWKLAGGTHCARSVATQY